METDRTVLILIIAGALLVTVGIFAWIVAKSRRRTLRLQQAVPERIEAAWVGTVVAVDKERKHPWYHTHPSLSAPRLLLHVRFRREDGSAGSFTVAKNKKTGADDPEWAVKFNLLDAAVHQSDVTDRPPAFDEVAERWKPGVRIEKTSGSFFPRITD